eukprot:scaffold241593_cov18-Prasinocladus_malaysianus.AAC.1
MTETLIITSCSFTNGFCHQNGTEVVYIPASGRPGAAARCSCAWLWPSRPPSRDQRRPHTAPAPPGDTLLPAHSAPAEATAACDANKVNASDGANNVTCRPIDREAII